MSARPSGRLCGSCRLLVRMSATLALTLALALSSCPAQLAGASLLQPQNYLLDDSPLTSQHDSAGSLSPYLNDAGAGPEQQADRDLVSIIGEGLARLRWARMLDLQRAELQAAASSATGEPSQDEAQLQSQSQSDQRSLSGSMAGLLLDAAQAAAADMQPDDSSAPSSGLSAPELQEPARDQLEASPAPANPSAAAASQPVVRHVQWYNPKETIPVLKISSMATPSKYKKVYFRSEKKLVDGAFHSPPAASERKPSLVKSAFGQATAAASDVQRRSSRGSHSSAPPSVMQDGVIDFLKKFRDVYVQTRPAGSAPAAQSPLASPINFASSFMSAAASSPLASLLAPGSGSSATRPSFLSALSTATQMVNGASMLSQATGPAAAGSSPSASGSASGSGSALAPAATGGAAGAGSAPSTGPNKAAVSAQTYVTFWSKTFPTWVRKVLKQMRRRSLHNSSKRQQHQKHHAISQKIASGSISSLAHSAPASASSSSSSSDSQSSSSSSSSS